MMEDAGSRIRIVAAADPSDFLSLWGDVDSTEERLLFYSLVPFIQCLPTEIQVKRDYEDIHQLACVLEAVGPEKLAVAIAAPEPPQGVMQVLERCYAPPTSATDRAAPFVNGVVGYSGLLKDALNESGVGLSGGHRWSFAVVLCFRAPSQILHSHLSPQRGLVVGFVGASLTTREDLGDIEPGLAGQLTPRVQKATQALITHLPLSEYALHP